MGFNKTFEKGNIFSKCLSLGSAQGLYQGRSQDFPKGGSQRLLTRLSCGPPRRASLLSLVYQRAQSYYSGMKAHIN